MAEEIRITDGTPYLPEIKELIVEYTGALGRDLTFQNLSPTGRFWPPSQRRARWWAVWHFTVTPMSDAR